MLDYFFKGFAKFKQNLFFFLQLWLFLLEPPVDLIFFYILTFRGNLVLNSL